MRVELPVGRAETVIGVITVTPGSGWTITFR